MAENIFLLIRLISNRKVIYFVQLDLLTPHRREHFFSSSELKFTHNAHLALKSSPLNFLGGHYIGTPLNHRGHRCPISRKTSDRGFSQNSRFKVTYRTN